MPPHFKIQPSVKGAPMNARNQGGKVGRGIRGRIFHLCRSEAGVNRGTQPGAPLRGFLKGAAQAPLSRGSDASESADAFWVLFWRDKKVRPPPSVWVMGRGVSARQRRGEAGGRGCLPYGGEREHKGRLKTGRKTAPPQRISAAGLWIVFLGLTATPAGLPPLCGGGQRGCRPGGPGQ